MRVTIIRLVIILIFTGTSGIISAQDNNLRQEGKIKYYNKTHFLGGYDPLLVNIIEFFKTGIVPVPKEQTLEIFAFMIAADESRKNGGKPVSIDAVMQNAIEEAKKMKF